MDQLNYRVSITPFAEKRYITKYYKTYKEKWLKTRQTIITVCERIDNILLYSRADLISVSGCSKLVKLDFSVEGTHVSPKASGNRCILLVDEDLRAVTILLVYSKNDISPPNETPKWKKEIKDGYPDIGELFNL